jgi:dihydrofolate reductase
MQNINIKIVKHVIYNKYIMVLPPFNLIVSMCSNNGIGYQGDLPWHIKHDLHYFAKMTKGEGHNAVVMGKNTLKSLKNAKGYLIDRDNLVLSSEMLDTKNDTIKFFTSINELDNYIAANDIYEDIWIIGGAQIYQQYLDLDKINKCYVTYIDKEFTCDIFFPSLDLSVWKEIERTDSYDNTYECQVSYRVYEKI